MGAVRGKDFKLYFNSDVPYDNSPTWVEDKNVRDVTRNLEKDLADASVRGSSFHMQLATLKTLSLDFQKVYDESDAAYIRYEQAFFDDSNVEFLVLDGDIGVAGSKGIRFLGQISKFGNNEALTDVGLTDVSVVPAYTLTDLPRRVSVVTPGTVTDVA
jgi:hypothetical protein